jgi:hypothetical protein
MSLDDAQRQNEAVDIRHGVASNPKIGLAVSSMGHGDVGDDGGVMLQYDARGYRARASSLQTEAHPGLGFA